MSRNWKENTIRTLLCGGLCVCAIGTTVNMAAYAANSTTASQTQSDEAKEWKDDGSVMVKIVSIDDSTLTAVVSEKPADGAKPEKGEKPADGETPPEKPADGETPPEKPADGETPPEKPADGDTDKIFSGDSVVLTLTDATTITKGMEHTASTISDLSENSVVRMVLDGTTVVSIDIMEMK